MALLVRMRHWWAVGREDSEALRDIPLHPGGELWGRFGVEIHESFEAGLGGGEILRVEDGSDVGGHAVAHVETWDVSLGVLLEMELAALPGHRGKDGLACGGHAWMGVADDELGAAQAACDQRREELAPMSLRFTQRHADAQDGAFAICADADGDEHGAVHQQAAMAHLLVAGIEDEIRAGFQRAVAPELELHIKPGRAGADLGGADLMAAEFLDDLGDFARRDALHIHFGHRECERLFAAHPALQRTGIEVDAVTHLRDAQFHSPHARGKGFGLEAIGVAEPPLATLVGPGLQHGRAFLSHGLIEQQAEAFGKIGGALRGEELQNGVEKIRVVVVGHV